MFWRIGKKATHGCACGYLNHPTRICSCSKRHVWWYRRKLSGPLLERIDMHIEVDPVPIEELMNRVEEEESSATVRTRILAARKIQSDRFRNLKGIHCNAQMPDSMIIELCQLEEVAKRFLFKQMEKLGLSARSYSRILKVARTISDLNNTS
ncbi:MAG: ATP-binding protein, partial [Sediminibacterium sp.]